jgi:hypothetical protein
MKVWVWTGYLCVCHLLASAQFVLPKPVIQYLDSSSHKGARIDTAKNGVTTAARKETDWRDYVNYFRLDFFATMHAFRYVNPYNQSEHGNLHAYYNFSLSNQFTSKYLVLHINLFNELGFRKFTDSILIKNEDSYFYKIDLSSPITKSCLLSTSYQVKSQIWPGWAYQTDSLQQQVRVLQHDFFSPGYIYFSGGLAWRVLDIGRLELGLAGGQITRIRNIKVYEAQQKDELFGVPKDKQRKVDVGLNMTFQLPPKKFGKRLYWENSSRLFIKGGGIGDVKNYQLDASNGLHLLFLKHLRIGFRNRVKYDATRSEKLSVQHMMLFGFYLSNKL